MKVSLDQIYRSSLFFGSGKCASCGGEIKVRLSSLVSVLIYLLGVAIFYCGMNYMGKSDFGPVFPVVLPMLGAYVWLGLGSYIFGHLEPVHE